MLVPLVLLLASHGQEVSKTTFLDRTSELGLQIGTDAACWIDFDGDGWTDLCAGGTLWRNRQGKSFEKVLEPGLVVAADYDNDGYPDLFSWSSLKLYHNEKGKSFTEAKLPELPPTVSRGACWGDFDGDGFVDLYVGGYEDWNKQITYPSFMLHNEGGNGFKIAWKDARYRARGVTACDFNQDGQLDIYVSDYRLQPNVLWVNEKAGFHDRASFYNVLATSPGFGGGHSIGACWGDFDNDGFFDLFAGNFAHVDSRGDQPKSRFLRNVGPAGGYKFEDEGPCGVWYQESYATPAAGDFDNDGRLDLFFTTVYGTASFGRRNFPVLYRNSSAGNLPAQSWRFEDVTQSAGVNGLPPTYQAAWADFDHDGRLDLVSGGKLFRNVGACGHWLEVRLSGDGKRVNRSAIGVQVRIRLKDRILSRQVEAGTGEGNQNDLTLHFGLGAWSQPIDLLITWPGGKTQTVRKVKLDRVVEVRE